MNRNTHGEDRTNEWRKLRAFRGWISWIESFVGQLRLLDSYVRWSVAFVGQIVVSIGTLEKIRFTEVECESDDDHVGLVYKGIMFAITSCQPAILNSL
ncbi:hypothetical protein T4B_11207 [Trichinella pseudospiralis]|uniref:Uncharacterized protein n=1 Tax=Trichinella pseudospiralis TaxID=6337 RepID=A0A0V1GJ80_TRIPS|nr:hypothetical protein T4B_11207 [Trichinella pseudospiralis]